MSIEIELRIEMGKIKGHLEKLKEEIKQTKLQNRPLYRSILLEIKSSLQKIKFFLLKPRINEVLKEVKTMNIPLIILQAYGYEMIENAVKGMIDPQISKVDSTIYCIDTPQYYNDEGLRKEIGNMIVSLDGFLTILYHQILAPFSLSLTGLPQIAELISMKPELTENWATANCYLSAMEIIVNKKRKELGLKEEEKEFNEKFKDLLNILQEKGLKVSELEKQLPSTFWKVRHKVIHAGYSPTTDELELIVTWTKKIITLLS